MKGTTAFEAMEGIDPRYILEAAPDAPIHTGNKARYIRILAVAATVAALTAVAVLGAGILKQSGENPPVVPPVGETQDGQTPTERENETAALPDGSYSTDLYTVEEIDGKHYINFVDGNEVPEGGSSGGNAMVMKGIYFSSLEEMRSKFLTGNFSTEEILNLKSQLELTDMGFEIADMTNLYDAVLPNEWGVYRVGLVDNNIYLSIQNSKSYNEETEDYTGEHGYVAFLTEDYFDIVYQRDFVSYVEMIRENVVDDETSFHGIPCQVYESSSDTVKLKIVVMEITLGSGSFDVVIKYCVDHKNEDLVNPDIPYSVSMYGEVFEKKIEIYLSGFESDPDGDFYQSFGIQPYKVFQ